MTALFPGTSNMLFPFLNLPGVVARQIFFAKALRKGKSAYQSFNPRPFPLGDECFQPTVRAARIARPGGKKASEKICRAGLSTNFSP